MKVGYCVPVAPAMASYRLRVAIPARNLGCQYVIWPADVCFFFKHQAGDIDRATDALYRNVPVVYDVVNDHFHGQLAQHYLTMCDLASTLTAGSWAMAERVKHVTGRPCAVIDDPYEMPEGHAGCVGDKVVWFGHSANIGSLLSHLDALDGANLVVCSNVQKDGVVPWSLENEARCIDEAAVVLLTGGNPGASTNRVVKALRAGRYVVTPEDCAESWREFAPFIWIGDVSEGIRWALNNREEACSQIRQGQDFVRDRYSPWEIGQQWRKLFDSTLGAETSESRGG